MKNKFKKKITLLKEKEKQKNEALQMLALCLMNFLINYSFIELF
jgi:hypothetical protein